MTRRDNSQQNNSGHRNILYIEFVCGEIRVNVSFDAKSLVFELTSGQVFWLPDHTTHRAFPSMKCSVAIAAFVPGYSGGTATDSHRLPYSSANDVSTDTHVLAESYRVRLQLQPHKKRIRLADGESESWKGIQSNYPDRCARLCLVPFFCGDNLAAGYTSHPKRLGRRVMRP